MPIRESSAMVSGDEYSAAEMLDERLLVEEETSA
jgi:hypothetical protein